MNRKYSIVLISFFFVYAAKAQTTATDSVQAAAYFKQSWDFPLHSPRHQLYLDSALMKAPTNAWYWQQKAMPLYKAQKYELGLPYLDSAVKYNAGRWLDYRAYMKCIFARTYREALTDFAAATKLNGNRPVMDHTYEFYMGLCYLQLNRIDSSKYYIDKCIHEDTLRYGKGYAHHLHYFYRAILALEEERTEEALAYFDKTLKQYTHFSDVEYYKAVLLMREKKLPEALALAKQAQQDFQIGYTINEDGALYEQYPYQVRPAYFKTLIQTLEEKLK